MDSKYCGETSVDCGHPKTKLKADTYCQTKYKTLCDSDTEAGTAGNMEIQTCVSSTCSNLGSYDSSLKMC